MTHYSHDLLSFYFFPPSSPTLSLLIWTLLATSFLYLPEAGNSHNCRPQLPSITGGGGVWLDLGLNAQLQREFVSGEQTKDAAPHLKGSATANWRSRV